MSFHCSKAPSSSCPTQGLQSPVGSGSCYPCDLISCLPVLLQPCCLDTPGMLRLRAFAHSVSSAWKALSSDVLLAPSLTSFRCLWSVAFSRKLSLITLHKIVPLSFSHSPSFPATWLYVYYCLCPLLEHKGQAFCLPCPLLCSLVPREVPSLSYRLSKSF